jgi:cytoskeletal protein RodZ
MSGLGEILKQQREIKNISLGEISQKTNISERILRALENNEFQHIPGKFYLNNFIKSYLNAIGLDEDAFFKNHRESINGIDDKNTTGPVIYYNKIRYSRFKRKNFFLGILLIIIISVFVTYFFMKNKERIAHIFQGTPKVIPATGMIYDYQDETINPDFSPVRIKINAQSDCWLQAIRSNKKFIERIIKAGEQINIHGYEILLTIGNPSTISLSINGSKSKKTRKNKNITSKSGIYF